MRVVTAMNPNYNPNVAGAARTSIFSWAYHPTGYVNTDAGPSAAGMDPDLEIGTTGSTSGTTASPSWLISGWISTGGVGVAGVSVVFTGVGTAATSLLGTYALAVPNAYSGVVFPTGIGGIFAPPFRAYVAVAANALNQDYVFTPAPPVTSLLISGTIAENGTGFSTAILATGLLPTFWSASNGSYGIAVDSGYSGTIRPVNIVAGTFVPANYVYTNVLAPYVNQNFAYSGTV